MSGFKPPVRGGGSGGPSPRNAVFASLQATSIITSKPVLPAEILSQIIDCLPPTSLIRVAQVSKRMREMVYDDTRWVRRLQLLGCWNEAEARKRRAETLQKQRERVNGHATSGNTGQEGSVTLFDAAPASNIPNIHIEMHDPEKTRNTSIASIQDGFDAIELASPPSAESKGMAEQSASPDTTSPLNILKHVRSVRGHARREYGRVHAALAPFYENAITVLNHAQAQVFRVYGDPNDRARMLANLLRFGNSDVVQGAAARQEKLAELVDEFRENVTREFIRAIDDGDSGKMKQYAHVLTSLDGGASAVELVVQRSPVLMNRAQFGDPVYCLDGMGDYSYEKSYAFFDKLRVGFNEQATILAEVFPPEVDTFVPFFLRVGQQVIDPFLTKLFNEAHRTYIESFLKAVSATCEQSLNWASTLQRNVSDEIFDETVKDMLTGIFEPHVGLYLAEELAWFKKKSQDEVSEWERQLSEQDASMESMFMANVNRQADKRDFLSSFKKVVMMPVNVFPSSKPSTKSANPEKLGDPRSKSPGSSRPASPAVNGIGLAPPTGEAPTTELAAKAAILNSRLEGIRSLFSIEVALSLVSSAKTSIERAVSLTKLGPKYHDESRLQCEMIFISLMQTLGPRHIQAGFDQAVEHLSKYNPREVASEQQQQAQVAPLATFLELVNVGDLIQQMLEVFYEQELVATKLIDRSDFLNPAVKEKKRFEQMLDSRVAAGLNKGIEVLITEVEHVLTTTQKPTDFNPEPPSNSKNNSADDMVGATPTATQVVELVSSHTTMLIGSTDKNTLDVFNQEVGMRLFSALCKHLKRQRISVRGGGAIRLICDVNTYHAYIATLRNKDLLQFFTALRELSQIFIVDPSDAKALATIIADQDRFKGIFSVEEVLEFAERRADWYAIRGKVERAMYGIGCEVM